MVERKKKKAADPFTLPPEKIVLPQGVCFRDEQPTEQPVEWITIIFDNGKHYRVAGKYLARRIAEKTKKSFDLLIRQPNTLIRFMKLEMKWREIAQFAFQYVDPKPFVEDDHLPEAKTGFILKAKPPATSTVGQAPNAKQAQSNEERDASGKLIKPPVTAYEHPFPDFEGDGDDGEVMDL